jgi:subtilisin family serine protease
MGKIISNSLRRRLQRTLLVVFLVSGILGYSLQQGFAEDISAQGGAVHRGRPAPPPPAPKPPKQQPPPPAPAPPPPAAYKYNTYSPQNGLLGLNDSIWADAHYGAGITYGVIDTGVAAPWIGFQNRVNTVDAVCTISNCPQSLAITDDEGHGTFVASEIAGDVRGFGLVGIAPAGTILPIKVLNANGSGFVSDVANGIIYGADHGAQVLNLSMTFIPTTDLVSAINYAASKNVVVVFAGGNSAQAFLNNATVTGFSDAAIQRLMFMGSTNLQEKLSSFSNTPGTGKFLSTSGKTYSFSSRWMMADGEGIWGASTVHDAGGYHYMTKMSGTSMSAPQAAAAAGLLAARWPFLITDGTIPAILLSTGQDLGTAGMDNVYGQGFMRIDRAFAPVGTLTVPVHGRPVNATQAAFVSGPVFGNAEGLAAAFAKATGYDDYRRDFSIDVSSAILKPSVAGTFSAAAQVSGQTGALSRTLTETGDGAWFAASFSDSSSYVAPILADGHLNMHQIQDPTRMTRGDWSFAFQQRDGSYFGAGQGSNAALSFNDARWGGKTAFFNNDAAVGGSLLGLTPSAGFASIGVDLSAGRLAIASMSAENDDLSALDGTHPSAQGAAASYTWKPAQDWTFSLSGAFLRENNMLLGSAGNGYLSLGQTSTTSVGFGTSVDLGSGYSFGVDTVVASSSASKNRDSLVTSTSRLTSAGAGIVLNKENVTGVGDNMSFSVRKPLRVYAGSAGVDVPTGTDVDGNPIMTHNRVGLAPSGNETDVGFSYRRPLAGGAEASFGLSYRQDADNVAGAKDGAVMFRYTSHF